MVVKTSATKGGVMRMSCTSAPGNRAVLIMARMQASAIANRPVTEREIQKAFHHLHREGELYHLPTPNERDVYRWFAEEEFAAYLDVQKGRSREAALQNLFRAREEWEADLTKVTGSVFHAWKFTASFAGYTAARRHVKDPVTVAFDCDGVLYSFNDTLREWLSARGWDRDSLPDPTSYSLMEAWGLNRHTLMEEMPLAVRAGVLWHNGPAFDDGVTAARNLGLAGHRIVVDTARSLDDFKHEAGAATITWLRANNVHPDVLHLCSPAHPEEKLEVHFDVLFDDHAENVKVALAAGREAYLVDRSWNKEIVGLPRVTFEEVPEIVERLRAPILHE